MHHSSPSAPASIELKLPGARSARDLMERTSSMPLPVIPGRHRVPSRSPLRPLSHAAAWREWRSRGRDRRACRCLRSSSISQIKRSNFWVRLGSEPAQCRAATNADIRIGSRRPVAARIYYGLASRGNQSLHRLRCIEASSPSERVRRNGGPDVAAAGAISRAPTTLPGPSMPGKALVVRSTQGGRLVHRALMPDRAKELTASRRPVLPLPMSPGRERSGNASAGRTMREVAGISSKPVVLSVGCSARCPATAFEAAIV